MMVKDKLMAFDVDGVLSGYGGAITRDFVNVLKEDWIVGIISLREDHAKVKEKFGMEFSYRWNGEALKQAMLDYPNLSSYVYVSDDLNRKPIAEALGWSFVSVTPSVKPLFLLLGLGLLLVGTLLFFKSLPNYLRK